MLLLDRNASFVAFLMNRRPQVATAVLLLCVICTLEFKSFAPHVQLVNQGTVAYPGGGLMRDVKNKAVLCKPLTLTKATYCKPHMQSKHLQTGERRSRSSCLPPKISTGRDIQRGRLVSADVDDGVKREYVPVPIPVPVFIPVPMNMYSQVTPTPLSIPVPVSCLSLLFPKCAESNCLKCFTGAQLMTSQQE